MATEVDTAQESVVLASFASRRAAEHMLGSLGHQLRRKARKGDVNAIVVRANKDGSLKVTQSRVLAAGDVLAPLLMATFMRGVVMLFGIFGTVKGIKGGVRAEREHGRHVESDEQRVDAILEQVGPGAALALICCRDAETGLTVAKRARERASHTWNGSRTDFLARLDPGGKDDWVRAALNKPPSAKHRRTGRVLHRAG